MKKITICLLAVALSGSFLSCEKEDTHVPVPVAPILKEVIFPNVNDVMPGRPAIIRGKGFSTEDILYIEDDVAMVKVEVLAVTDAQISFLVPANAGGTYTVTVERAGLQSTLDGELNVPFVIVLENVVMPANSFAAGATVTIAGEGFETGDEINLTASFYPENKVVVIPAAASASGISFVLPSGVYGINNVIVTRGAQRKSILGTIGIEANVGDEVGGGVVYYTEASKLHGYIVNKTNTGTPVQQFGPGLALSGAAGTSKAIGSGKSNTSKLQNKLAAFRSGNASWNNKKAAFELCDELNVTVNGDVYSDWFLPSQEELIEIFKAKDMLVTKGATVPANNYWSSSEGDGDAAGWSAFYVNFYESVNIVSANSDKEGWQIGIRAIRSF